jgi:hypothetical protein
MTVGGTDVTRKIGLYHHPKAPTAVNHTQRYYYKTITVTMLINTVIRQVFAVTQE